LAVLLAATLSFLSVKFYLDNQLEYQEGLIESSHSKTGRIASLERDINRINDILSEFNYFYEQQFAVSGLLDKVSVLLPSGALLESFSYNKESGKVMISGLALDVEQAYEFRNILREQDWLNNLAFTLPDWLQAGKINFRAEFNSQK